jgi:HAD superfamily hydrolase (TIGR01484 family)
MNTKYIFLDIDGTLLSHSYGVSKSSIDAINQLHNNGHKVFISTGRSKSYVDDYIRRLPFDSSTEPGRMWSSAKRHSS